MSWSLCGQPKMTTSDISGDGSRLAHLQEYDVRWLFYVVYPESDVGALYTVPTWPQIAAYRLQGSGYMASYRIP